MSISGCFLTRYSAPSSVASSTSKPGKCNGNNEIENH